MSRLPSVADEVAQSALQNAERSRRFRQSILKWAFEGKLVDHDLNDEPPAVLLEHIRSERAGRAEEDGTVRVARKR